MEKRIPAYDIEAIKEAARRRELKITRSAARSAFEMGLDVPEEICEVVERLERHCFFKSMTTYADHTRWQDVYHIEHHGLVIYAKFMIDQDGHLVVSFKPK